MTSVPATDTQRLLEWLRKRERESPMNTERNCLCNVAKHIEAGTFALAVRDGAGAGDTSSAAIARWFQLKESEIDGELIDAGTLAGEFLNALVGGKFAAAPARLDGETPK